MFISAIILSFNINICRMRNVGFCGVEEITNTLAVLEDLERLALEDRVFGDSGVDAADPLQHEHRFSPDEAFA